MLWKTGPFQCVTLTNVTGECISKETVKAYAAVKTPRLTAILALIYKTEMKPISQLCNLGFFSHCEKQ